MPDSSLGWYAPAEHRRLEAKPGNPTLPFTVRGSAGSSRGTFLGIVSPTQRKENAMVQPMFPRNAWTRIDGRLVAGVLAIAILGFAHTSAAQALKRYVTPDGKTIYSDTPVPGAKLVGEVAPPPPAPPSPDRAARQQQKDGEAKGNRAVSGQLSAPEAQRKRVEEASAKLEQAKGALEEGRAPRAGERIGTAGGASRLTENYFARQRANEQAVKRAEDELRKARGQ
jgi:hypothetical protein